MRSILYLLWLSDAVTPYQGKRLIDNAKNAENIYNMDNYESFNFLTEKAKRNLLKKDLKKYSEIIKQCQKLDISIIPYYSDDYPPNLKNTNTAPLVLYARGVLPRLEEINPIAIVGTRQVSFYGAEIARLFGSELSKNGFTVVSGFASGIDTIAMREAFKEGFFTIAVLGCGVDVVYPYENRELYEKMLQNCLFLSEYPPGTKPDRFNFPKRNKIISGISNCVVVIEAPEKSGAIITAKSAMAQNKKVFAIPGPVNRPSSAGTNILLKDGAIVATSPRDIISIMGASISSDASIENHTSNSQETDEIILALKSRDMTVDQLCNYLDMPVSECNSRCFMLELEGKITKLPGNLYTLK